ncbi:MAG TPA: MFS transporter [Methylovirgula sp.]
MTPNELRATGSLAAVFALRLLGLFMIYPVFSAYAHHLQGTTPFLIGVALGAYGLTQGLLQIPFGLVSDKIGRKPVIALGLAFFGFGSIVAALSSSIYGVILGRILQGTGAVGSVVLALVADLTREEVRTRAMAGVGITIGLSFVVAIVVGPLIDSAIGVQGIFWITAGLALIGIAITLWLVPTPQKIVVHRDAEAVPSLFARVLSDPQLLRLDFAIFALHAILTASFLAVPPLIASSLHLAGRNDWMVYLPILLASVVLMVPVIIVAEKGGRMKEVFLASIALLAASLVALAFGGSIGAVVILALVGFFTAFNIMEAMLPSLVTKSAPADAKGTATGIYSSLQFLGIFVGGVGGGWANSVAGAKGVFIFTVLVAVIWLILAATMSRPRKVSNYLVHLTCKDEAGAAAIEAKLKSVPGVIEAVVVRDVAYLKIDRARFDAKAVTQIVGS